MIRRTRNAPAPAPSRDAFDFVVDAVCRYYEVSPLLLSAPGRLTHIVRARWMVMLLAYELTGAGRERIGAWLRKDKATVLHGLREMRRRMKADHTLANDHETLRQQLAPRLAALDPRPELTRAAEVSADYARVMDPHLARIRGVMAGIAPIVVDAVMASVEHACAGIVRELDGVSRSLARVQTHVDAAAQRDPLQVAVRILDLESRRGAATNNAPIPSTESKNGEEKEGVSREAAGAAGPADTAGVQ